MLETLSQYFQFPFVRYAFIVGILISLCSSLLGVTLVLKRFSFIGDGLSHVAFGAMAIATVLNLSNNMYLILPVTIISAILLLKANKNTKIQGDAALAMISVGALAIGYLLMNIFSTSSNLTGDVCSTLFGSTSILTLTKSEVWLCTILSVSVIAAFIIFYNKIFAVTFDQTFAQAVGTHASVYNMVIAIIIAIIIVLAMNLVGSLLISALVIFPAISAMRLFKSFKSVTICSAIISVVCSASGLLISILAGTPVGSTIVAADIFVFIIFSILSYPLTRSGFVNFIGLFAITGSLFLFSGTLTSCSKKNNTTDSVPFVYETEDATPVDVDLTKMSATMIYSQVFNMLVMPEEYENKVIKVKGKFSVLTNDITKERIFAVLIPDATACCQQGLSFVWQGEHSFPHDYPEQDQEIVITGRYIISEIQGMTYNYLDVFDLRK